MQDIPRHRKLSELIHDFEDSRARCERVSDELAGLAVLFAVAAALTLSVGVWAPAPLLAVSGGFALAATVGFAAAAHAAAAASRAAPRLRRVHVAARVEKPRRAA
jgi:hypothetical protein